MKFIVCPDTIFYSLGGYPDGTEIYLNEQGQIHRDGAPAVIYPNGAKEWYRNGKLHRDDGPAVENPITGDWEWLQNGERHRIGGPAVIRPDGVKAWWINGAWSGNQRLPDELVWDFLKSDPESCTSFYRRMTPEMQEYILKLRPDLIGFIKCLDSEVKAKYAHEIALAKVDL